MFQARDSSTATMAPPKKGAYERKRAQTKARDIAVSKSGRDIAEDFPELTDRKLIAKKRRMLADFRLFAKTCFPRTFYLPWSKDHRRIIGKLVNAIIHGGQLAFAMPRGSGKSAILAAACLWAILNGHHQFIVIVAATDPMAVDILKGIRMQLETNDLLLKFWPEVCFPIRKLEGVSQRRLLWNGERIRIEMTDNRLVMPSLPPNPAASAILDTVGITGAIRGRKYTRPDGDEVRPGLVALDDPQTRESANSEKQCNDREETVNGDCLGLAGPDKNITALATITIIKEGDLSSRMLDRVKNPQWRGERTRMVEAWPTHPDAERLWAEWTEIYKNCMREDRPTTPATAHYRKNRRVMDQGAVLAWPERKVPGTISALETAFKFKTDKGESAFAAEYQNAPIQLLTAKKVELLADKIVARLNRIERGTVPSQIEKLTAFIDIQEQVLFWMVCGWDGNFGGSIISYGTWPEQNRLHFDLTNLTRTLQDELPHESFEAQLHHGLTTLTGLLLGREWHRDGGGVVQIEKCPIDANWHRSSDLVYEFCRSSPFKTVIIPSHGKGYGAKGKSMNEWAKKPGDIAGTNWRMPLPSGKRVIRHLLYDTNHWKSHAAARLLVPMGGPSGLVLNGMLPSEHQLLADHLTSEYAVRVKVNEREVDEWMLHVGRRNDWWDGLVGNCVAGSVLGCVLKQDAPPVVKAKRSFQVSF